MNQIALWIRHKNYIGNEIDNETHNQLFAQLCPNPPSPLRKQSMGLRLTMTGQSLLDSRSRGKVLRVGWKHLNIKAKTMALSNLTDRLLRLLDKDKRDRQGQGGEGHSSSSIRTRIPEVNLEACQIHPSSPFIPHGRLAGKEKNSRLKSQHSKGKRSDLMMMIKKCQCFRVLIIILPVN